MLKLFFVIPEKNNLGIIFVAVTALIIGMIGCGKKAPPVPPHRLPPAPASDISIAIDGDELVVSWTVRQGKDPRSVIPAQAGVYRSEYDLSEPPCKGCPILFQKIATLIIPPGVKKDTVKMFYRDTIKPGFGYVYKVVLFSENQMASENSGTVRWEPSSSLE